MRYDRSSTGLQEIALGRLRGLLRFFATMGLQLRLFLAEAFGTVYQIKASRTSLGDVLWTFTSINIVIGSNIYHGTAVRLVLMRILSMFKVLFRVLRYVIRQFGVQSSLIGSYSFVTNVNYSFRS